MIVHWGATSSRAVSDVTRLVHGAAAVAPHEEVLSDAGVGHWRYSARYDVDYDSGKRNLHLDVADTILDNTYINAFWG